MHPVAVTRVLKLIVDCPCPESGTPCKHVSHFVTIIRTDPTLKTMRAPELYTAALAIAFPKDYAEPQQIPEPDRCSASRAARVATYRNRRKARQQLFHPLDKWSRRLPAFDALKIGVIAHNAGNGETYDGEISVQSQQGVSHDR